jgi:hypothetical protein
MIPLEKNPTAKFSIFGFRAAESGPSGVEAGRDESARLFPR